MATKKEAPKQPRITNAGYLRFIMTLLTMLVAVAVFGIFGAGQTALAVIFTVILMAVYKYAG